MKIKRKSYKKRKYVKNKTFSIYSYLYISFLIIFLILIQIYILIKIIFRNISTNNQNKQTIQNNINKNETETNNRNTEIIKIGYYCNSFKNGGVERVMSLLLNYLSTEKIFKHYIITKNEKEEGEYAIPNDTIRICLSQSFSLFDAIKKINLDILIYNFYKNNEIKELNKLKNTKTIFYDHSSYFYWLNLNHYNFQNSVYSSYKECKYVISIIPIENNYLFKKWGISSILMDNFATYEYDSVTPSNLNNKNIIMIGRAYDPIKRFDLGIKAMQTIIKEIPDCIMNVITTSYEKFQSLAKELNLGNYINFLGYISNPYMYFQNSSLHIMPSLSESYPMVLVEAKVFGIPTILCGLDYLALSKGGTVIIYDDTPENIGKEAIKILKDNDYRKKLGIEARDSMKMRKNEIIKEKWIKLLVSIYKGDKYYQELVDSQEKMPQEEIDQILNNQLSIFKHKNNKFKSITLEQFASFNFH